MITGMRLGNSKIAFILILFEIAFLGGCNTSQSEVIHELEVNFLEKKTSYEKAVSQVYQLKSEDNIRRISIRGGPIEIEVNDKNHSFKGKSYKGVSEMVIDDYFHNMDMLVELINFMEEENFINVYQGKIESVWFGLPSHCCPALSIVFSNNISENFTGANGFPPYEELIRANREKDNTWIYKLDKKWHIVSLNLGF